MTVKNFLFLFASFMLLSSCAKEENTTQEDNQKEEVSSTDAGVKIIYKELKDPACSYFENRLPELLEATDNDFFGDCMPLDNQFGAKTSFVVNGIGTGFYLSALENKFTELKEVDIYYEKFMAIPQKEIKAIQNIGEGAIWMPEEKMLAFSKSGHNFVIVSNTKEGPEDYDLNLAKKVAMDMISHYQL